MIGERCVNIGVVGLGRLGRVHAHNLAWGIRGAQLVAVADTDPLVIEREHDALPAEVWKTTDWRAVVNSPQVEAVVVVTTSETHGPIVMEALQANKHVFVEKPLTLDLDEAERIVEKVKRTDRILAVGFMRRFETSYQEAHRAILKGTIGKPFYFSSYTLDGVISDSEKFLANSGGILLDVAIHDLDLAEWLMGEPIQEIRTLGTTATHTVLQQYNDVDSATVELRFQSGALGHIFVSHAVPYGYDVHTTIIGTMAAVTAGTPWRDDLLWLTSAGIQLHTYRDFTERFQRAYRNELQTFVDVLVGRETSQEAIVNAEAALRSLRLAHLATTSLREGGTVQRVGGEFD